MAIFHCSVKVGSRSAGKSAVASSCYREGKKIVDERTGEIHDYSRKNDVIESLTLIPSNAPDKFKDSSVLWNTVEHSEKRKDAQLFREVEVALPRELSHAKNKALTLEYVNENFVSKGMCATVSFHESKSENPHAHIMLTTRSVDQDGFGKKNRNWNDRALVENWRESWSESVNKQLKNNGIDQSIDHRSFERQGIERLPTVHLGHVAHAMEKSGRQSERGDINRAVIAQNESNTSIQPDGLLMARNAFNEHQRGIEEAKRAKDKADKQRNEQRMVKERERSAPQLSRTKSPQQENKQEKKQDKPSIKNDIDRGFSM